MTHEQHSEVFDEPFGGPRYDHRLPDAGDIPEHTDVEASLAPPMHDTAEQLLEQTWAGAEPGWWEGAPSRWAGTEPNEV